MIDGREQARLALEAVHPIAIGREGRRQDLDGDVATEFAIAGAVDLAHAAFAQLRGDLVIGKSAADEVVRGHHMGRDRTHRRIEKPLGGPFVNQQRFDFTTKLRIRSTGAIEIHRAARPMTV